MANGLRETLAPCVASHSDHVVRRNSVSVGAMSVDPYNAIDNPPARCSHCGVYLARSPNTVVESTGTVEPVARCSPRHTSLYTL